ncbi:MAG: helix-turn-helix domain-containing protein [Actinomycetota bacterium]|nr:helix-turn-helix domain-containing protein [Actinomycetota bacterium]
MRPERLIRDARRDAGLTQAELADRLGTTQSAIARLEAEGANPRVSTLTRALDACDRDVVLEAKPRRSSIDETLVTRRLRLPPGERIKSFERSYANVREFALAGARSRGELA